MLLSEIHLRDPFILKHNNRYYLYGSRADGIQEGFDVYVSRDLKNFSSPSAIFEKNADFWGKKQFWAPEVYYVDGRFYMFATFKADGICRSTDILVSDKPEGPFKAVSENRYTPADWETLDGSLYIDAGGKKHMIFCHEWVDEGIGTICETELNNDMTRSVSEPRVLFKATDAEWAVGIHSGKHFITDGPFMYRGKNLYMLWSSFGKNGYTVGTAVSDNGEIDGNWHQQSRPLYEADGGHGMIFTDFNGKTYLIIHSPNTNSEHPVLFEIYEENDELKIINRNV